MELPERGAPPITFGGDLIKIRFDDIKRDSFGRIERPVLVLKKPHDEIIGSLGLHFGLEMDFKFNEVSTGSFAYPKRVSGRRTALYDQLINGRLVQMDPYGVYVITQTEDTDDGVRKVKQVEISSLEQELVDKKVIFAEGVYNFWNPADVENTVLGMMMSGVRNWKIGDVATSLWGKYRTFAQTDTNVLSFALETLQETYGCIFLFNTYTRTIDVLDANDEVATMPVYLSHQNLIDEDRLTENSESLFTKLYVSGADGVDIRNVNPTGDSYIYNLDYYISIGDISGELADKYRAWQDTIFARQAYYKSLVALRNSAMARYVTESARLTDMQNELSTLNHTMATFADMLKKDLQADNRTYFEERSSEVGTEVGQLETDIVAQKALLETIQAEYEEHIANIAAVNKELNYAYYFTDDEKDILDHYLKETDFTDTTFAVFNIDSTEPGSFAAMDTATINMTNVKWWDVECGGEHSLGTVVGGQLSISGNGVDVTAEIVNATIDHDGSEIVASFYLGKGTNNGSAFASGNLTCVGAVGSSNDALLAQMAKHEDTLTNDEGTVSHTAYYYTGSPSINITSGGSVYFTRNVTEYQRYSVQQELYDYATEKAKSISMPTYMFEIECGNILFEKHFEAFRHQIQLGCGVYLQLDNDVMVKPTLLEMHVNFEKPDDYKLVFANTFQRPDQVATFKDFMTKATAANKQLDINRHNTFQNNNTTLWVDEILKAGFDAALHRITAGPEQSVVIDGTGITVDSVETSMTGPDGEVITMAPDKIVITNGMIALVERDEAGNENVKMAMGHFYDDNLKNDFVGVLADVICGTLVAGKNLIIECPGTDGEPMQFKVDSTGVTINNGRIYLRSTDGLIGLDPNYGFMASDTPYEELFVTDGDTGEIYPVCYTADGELVTDKDENGVEFPKDVTVLITKDGKAYFKGDVYANNGYFSGYVNASGGKFKGTVQASDFLDANGKSMMTEDGKIDGDYLDLRGVNIVDEDGNVIFEIDEDGIHWTSASSPVQFQYATTLDAQDPPENEADKIAGVEYWHPAMTEGDKYRRESYDGGATWGAGYLIVAENGKDGEPGQNGNNVQYQYSNNQEDWYDTYFVGAVYRRDSTDGGQTWEPKAGYKFVGTDATVTYENVKRALNDAANAGLTITTTTIGEKEVETPTLKSANLYSSKIYGTNIYAGDGTSDDVYANMNGNGFYVYHTDATKPKLSMVTTAEGNKIQIIMGAGGSTDATSDYGRFCIEKVYVKEGDPGNGTSLIYHGAEDVGFTFNHDGKITVLGTLDGLSPVAVFGE